MPPDVIPPTPAGRAPGHTYTGTAAPAVCEGAITAGGAGTATAGPSWGVGEGPCCHFWPRHSLVSLPPQAMCAYMCPCVRVCVRVCMYVRVTAALPTGALTWKGGWRWSEAHWALRAHDTGVFFSMFIFCFLSTRPHSPEREGPREPLETNTLPPQT